MVDQAISAMMQSAYSPAMLSMQGKGQQQEDIPQLSPDQLAGLRQVFQRISGRGQGNQAPGQTTINAQGQSVPYLASGDPGIRDQSGLILRGSMDMPGSEGGFGLPISGADEVAASQFLPLYPMSIRAKAYSPYTSLLEDEEEMVGP